MFHSFCSIRVQKKVYFLVKCSLYFTNASHLGCFCLFLKPRKDIFSKHHFLKHNEFIYFIRGINTKKKNWFKSSLFISLNNFSITILDMPFDIFINWNVSQSIQPLYLQDNRPHLCSSQLWLFCWLFFFNFFIDHWNIVFYIIYHHFTEFRPWSFCTQVYGRW